MPRIPTQRQRNLRAQSPVAACYVRVSTDDQKENGISEAAQIAAVLRYVMANRLTVVGDHPPGDEFWRLYPADGIFNDAGVSGKIPLRERPAGRSLARLIEDGKIGHVVVTKLDRLTRNTADIDYIRKRFPLTGVKLHVIDMGGEQGATVADNVKLGFMGEFAQMFRLQIAENTRSALEYKREKGEKTGGRVPYGCRVVVRGEATRNGVTVPLKALEIDPAEVQAVMLARRVRAGGASLRETGRAMVAAGFPPRRGRAWDPSQVRTLATEGGVIAMVENEIRRLNGK